MAGKPGILEKKPSFQDLSVLLSNPSTPPTPGATKAWPPGVCSRVRAPSVLHLELLSWDQRCEARSRTRYFQDRAYRNFGAPVDQRRDLTSVWRYHHEVAALPADRVDTLLGHGAPPIPAGEWAGRLPKRSYPKPAYFRNTRVKMCVRQWISRPRSLAFGDTAMRWPLCLRAGSRAYWGTERHRSRQVNGLGECRNGTTLIRSICVVDNDQ